ncbi:YqkE family protein [Bacillus alkalicellulosilyticus]|uniref:YqkE family protein n=1 Tax=Alkalihalobacterium alkalicellulosilyticum TaxID=1912214 RepID=UPI001FEA15C6|nr:YqkE family protein [Bacillus alkalicellulosilyticus]
MKKHKKENDQNWEIRGRISEDVLAKLKKTAEVMKKQEAETAEQQRLQRIEERKEKEKNKSFEELLEESDLDWQKYK